MSSKQRYFELPNRTYPYKLRRSRRARNILLHVNNSSEVELVVPWHVSFWRAEAFVKERHGWLEARINEIAQKRLTKIFDLEFSEKEYRQQAQEYFTQLCQEIAQQVGVQVGQVRIGKFKSQWGSADKRTGRLTFDWRLLLAPPVVAQYVATHEVCHLCHANHSTKFWALVAITMPNYTEGRTWLKQYGQNLQVVV